MAQSKKVFIDSSVLIAALLSSRGGSFYILTQRRDNLTFYINEYVLDEVVRVLREKFEKNKNLEHHLYLLIGFAEVEVLSNPAKNQIQPLEKIIEKEDTPILSSALQCCDFLLTLDNDFLHEKVISFAGNKNTQIVKPADLIQYMGKSNS